MKLIKNKIDHLTNPDFENHFNLLEQNQNLRIEYLSLPKVEVTSYLLNGRSDNLTSIENDIALITTSHTFPTINPHTLKTSLIGPLMTFGHFKQVHVTNVKNQPVTVYEINLESATSDSSLTTPISTTIQEPESVIIDLLNSAPNSPQEIQPETSQAIPHETQQDTNPGPKRKKLSC